MRTLLLITLLLATAPMAAAQNVAEKLGDSPSFEELSTLYQQYYDKWLSDVQEQQGLESPHWPEYPAVEFFPFFETAARAGKKQAMDWVLTNYGNVPWPGEEMRALKLHCVRGLMASEAGSEFFLTAVQALTYDWNPQNAIPWAVADEILLGMDKRIAKEDKELRSRLLYARYSVHDRRADAKGTKLAIHLLEQLEKEFSDTRVGSMAKGLLFDKRHLQVGMKAPEFVGVNVDGEEIRLSDYKGKVTYLVFWGFW
jgi:hypothetical protein